MHTSCTDILSLHADTGYTKYSVEKYKNIHDTFNIFKNTYTHELYKCVCKWKCNVNCILN